MYVKVKWMKQLSPLFDGNCGHAKSSTGHTVLQKPNEIELFDSEPSEPL